MWFIHLVTLIYLLVHQSGEADNIVHMIRDSFWKSKTWCRKSIVVQFALLAYSTALKINAFPKQKHKMFSEPCIVIAPSCKVNRVVEEWYHNPLREHVRWHCLLVIKRQIKPTECKPTDNSAWSAAEPLVYIEC